MIKENKMASHAHTHAHAGSEDFIIGFHVGPAGRWMRLIFGVYFLVFFVVNPLVLNSQPLNDFLPFAGEIALWVLGWIAIYLVTFYFLGELLLSKMNPWTGTSFFLGLPSVAGMYGLFPQPMQIGFGIYIDLSLALLFFMRYGGCEVVALPSLLMGTRYTMYCPLNAFDAVEHGVTPDKGYKSETYLAMISLTITLFVGSWFYFIETMGLLGRYGIDWHIDKRWALLLLIPVVHLTYLGWKIYRETGQWRHKTVIKYAIGSIILALMVGVFLKIVNFGMIWQSLMVFGALYVLFEVFQFLTGRKKFEKKDRSHDLTTPVQATGVLSS